MTVACCCCEMLLSCLLLLCLIMVYHWAAIHVPLTHTLCRISCMHSLPQGFAAVPEEG